MSMDLQRFHATYFEESREGLDAMEAGLLELEGGSTTTCCWTARRPWAC